MAAYRGGSEEFSGFRGSETGQTPGKIPAHTGDLLDESLRAQPALEVGGPDGLRSLPAGALAKAGFINFLCLGAGGSLRRFYVSKAVTPFQQGVIGTTNFVEICH
jgi:hypothetical protein